MLELPPTIRNPRLDEIPNNTNALEKLKRRETANIEEGFKFIYNETHDLPFKFFCEINIDNSRLWSLFKALTQYLPNNICLLYNLFDEEPIYSPYLDKELILNTIEDYELELIQDCYLEFGVLFQSETILEEIFITESKFIKVWGNEEEIFRKVMRDFEIQENPNLNFVDEFPKVVEPLIKFKKNARKPDIVIAGLNQSFKQKKKSWKFW
jgi:hypothetical protein